MTIRFVIQLVGNGGLKKFFLIFILMRNQDKFCYMSSSGASGDIINFHMGYMFSKHMCRSTFKAPPRHMHVVTGRTLTYWCLKRWLVGTVKVELQLLQLDLQLQLQQLVTLCNRMSQRLTMGVTNPCDGHGLVMSRVTPLHITNVETL